MCKVGNVFEDTWYIFVLLFYICSTHGFCICSFRRALLAAYLGNLLKRSPPMLIPGVGALCSCLIDLLSFQTPVIDVSNTREFIFISYYSFISFISYSFISFISNLYLNFITSDRGEYLHTRLMYLTTAF